MDVTRSNFEQLLPLIKTKIAESDFISFDCELTGLYLPDTQVFFTESVNERYSKIKPSVEEFSVIQYGICGFKYTSSQFIASPFNFYVHASGSDIVQLDRLISFSANSLKFLRSNQFDFNKLIDSGIPYFSFSDEANVSVKGGRLKGAEWRPINESSLQSKMKRYLQTKRKEIAKWFLSGQKQGLVIQVNSTAHKKLIRQEIQDPRYQDCLQATERDSKHLLVVKSKFIQPLRPSVIQESGNFRTVIELIQQAMCPVIGHNALFDVLHTVHHFWRRLPVELEDFKLVTNQMWKTIVDTKYLAENHPSLKRIYSQEGTNLGMLYDKVTKEIKQQIVMTNGFDRYNGEDGKTKHEAGYDAYMTGVVYIALVNHLKDEGALLGKKEESSDIETSLFFNDPSITPYYNRIFVPCKTPYLSLRAD